MDLRTKEELDLDLKHSEWDLENACISFDESKRLIKEARQKHDQSVSDINYFKRDCEYLKELIENFKQI